MRTGTATTWRFLLAVFAAIALTLAILPGCDDDSGGGNGSDDTNMPVMMPPMMECNGGVNDGMACMSGVDCPGGSCDPV